MSVLIKDMEKPKSCFAVIDGEPEYCPFVNTDDDCVLLLKKGICEGTWEEQYSKCPLVEEPERKKGEWIDYSDEGYVVCPFCHNATNCDGNKDELRFCFSCGAELR